MEVKQALIACVLEARAKEKGFRENKTGLERNTLPECVGGSTLLVFRGRVGVTLWTVETASQYPNPIPVGVNERALAGDGKNPAVFFLEQYFSRVPNNLNALIPLAVHTVLMAKSDFVEGLQVGVFTRDIFRTLTEEELKPFIEMSKEVDYGMLGQLTKPSNPRVA